MKSTEIRKILIIIFCFRHLRDSQYIHSPMMYVGKGTESEDRHRRAAFDTYDITI